MPVTKTAKRALKGSLRKQQVNNAIRNNLEIAIRNFKKKSTKENLIKVVSSADIAVKKNIIHKNKAARIKRKSSKLVSVTKKSNISKAKTSINR